MMNFVIGALVMMVGMIIMSGILFIFLKTFMKKPPSDVNAMLMKAQLNSLYGKQSVAYVPQETSIIDVNTTRNAQARLEDENEQLTKDIKLWREDNDELKKSLGAATEAIEELTSHIKSKDVTIELLREQLSRSEHSVDEALKILRKFDGDIPQSVADDIDEILNPESSSFKDALRLKNTLSLTE